MTHDSEVHTLAAPYALHALPDDEVALFEEHLLHCSSCRDEVDEIREVAARMGAAEAAAPPEELKRRVLERVAEIRPLPPLVDTERSYRADRRHAGDSRWRTWWPRLSLGAAAALLVVVGVLSAILVDQSQQLDDKERLQAQIQRVATAPDMRQVTQRTADGQAVVLAARSTDTVVVMPTGMEPAPDGRTYQAWFIKDKEIRSAGLLRGDDGDLRPLVSQGLDDATQIGITVEPEGGSQQPTTDPVMVFDVSA